MSEELLRLSKLMARRGLCSRREADVYIEQGLVRVDGVVISQLGTRVSPTVSISLDPKAQRQQRALATIILNKPIGYVSAQPEPAYIPAITLITQANRFDNSRTTSKSPAAARSAGSSAQRLKPEHLRGLAVAGRLDIDSQGLLLFTQDGRVAKRVVGENSDLEKEYIVRVTSSLPDEQLRLLRHGLHLDGRALKPARVEWINDDQLRFVLREGRKRQIRRMCEMVGLEIIGLKRVRVGRIRLGNLPEGKWRFLRPDESLD